MTELVRTETVGAFDPRNEQVVKYLGLNPADPKAVAVVAVARRYDLDPLLKHVIIVESKGKSNVYITRDGLLHIAHQSGVLDGIVVEQEPELSDDGREWVSRVSVWRKDMAHPFTFPGRYPVNGTNKEYAQEMSLKAAESHALRRAFAVAGLPAYDEHRAEQAPVRATATRKAPPRTVREALGIEPEPSVDKTTGEVQTDDWHDPRLDEEPTGQSALGAALAKEGS